MAEKPSVERREQLDQCAIEAMVKLREIFAGTLDGATPCELAYFYETMSIRLLEDFSKGITDGVWTEEQVKLALRFMGHMANGRLTLTLLGS